MPHYRWSLVIGINQKAKFLCGCNLFTFYKNFCNKSFIFSVFLHIISGSKIKLH